MRNRIIKLLEEVWNLNPDLRLGQIISNAKGLYNVYYVEDEIIEAGLEKMIAKYSVVNVCFVLDETGSMMGQMDKVISGFKEYASGLDNKTRLTLIKFNSHKVETVYEDFPANEIPELNYMPDGMTPLYDAVGRAISVMSRKNGPVFITIMTDGMENCSKEFSKPRIQNLIKQKTKAGWTFAFMGADQDSWGNIGDLGIPKGNVMDFNDYSKGFKSLREATISYSSSGGTQSRSIFGGNNE